jgi:MFS family permease
VTSSRTAPLRVPAFRWFFLGQLVNSAGSSMAGIALAFAVLAISDSPAALGAVMAGWTVPMVAFMLLGGALADRMPRGLVLRGCNLVEAVAQTATAALVLTGYAEVWQLVALQLVSGTASAVSYPAEHGMVPVLLPRELRQSGYLLMSQSRSATTIGGPALAGLLVATAGPGYALAFVAAGFLTLMRLPPGERPDRRASVLGDFRAGWSFARELGWVIPASSCALVFNALYAGAVGVLGPTIAEGTIGSEGWGLAQSAQAVGVFVTALALSRVVIRRPMVVIMVAFAAMGLPMLVLGTSVDLLLLSVAFAGTGAALSVLDLAWNMTVQEKVPEEMLSRIQSIDGFFSFVGMPVGQLLVGPLALALGTRSVELGCAALCVVVALVALSRPVIAGVRLESPSAAAAS